MKHYFMPLTNVKKDKSAESVTTVHAIQTKVILLLIPNSATLESLKSMKTTYYLVI